MAGKELDPQRARAARDVVRQHPAMSVIALSPVLIGAGLVWWLAGPWWAILSLVAATVIGGRAVLRKR
jgi:1,4-dihydroxy-2-naphthoate octaprenyltransferase